MDIKDFKIETTDGIEYVPWDNIKDVLGSVGYENFCTWMRGQTCIQEGAYVCDVQNYLRHPSRRFFD